MQNVKTQLLRRRSAATISSPLISASSGDRDRLPGDPDLPGYGDGLAGEYVDHLAAAYADGPAWICKGLWCLWLSSPYKKQLYFLQKQTHYYFLIPVAKFQKTRSLCLFVP